MQTGRYISDDDGASHEENMRTGGHRARISWRIGTRKAADYLIMARIRDRALSSLITTFPLITGMTCGEAREPHVTLFGPFRTRVQGDVLVTRIQDAAKGLDRLSCTIGEMVQLKGVRGGAIVLRLSPGPDLTGFYRQLVSAVPPLTSRCTWIDRDPGHRIFHISLRFNVPFREFDSFWKRAVELPLSPGYDAGEGKGTNLPIRTYLQACDSPVDIFRIALVRRGAIWKEFDLPRSTWLSRKESGDTQEWRNTYRRYREVEGMELHEDAHGGSLEQYVVADLHLGHRNIIQYCRRPFSSSEEMDQVLIGNWNHRISQGDEVFYLGDLCHGKHAAPASEYLSRLNGRIHFIAGNHDEAVTGALSSFQLKYDSYDFFLIHDPAQAPLDHTGWVIHGHLHNNDLATYPFINAGTQTINVSAEQLGYIPVSLAELCGFLRRVQPGEKIGSLKEARARYSSK
jgi:calcineurin-like phosphoesterase family protein